MTPTHIPPTADERERQFIETLNNTQLSPAELCNEVLRENRIQTLFQDISSIQRARSHFNRLSAAVAGIDTDSVPESAEWVAALQQLREQQKKVEELGEAARKKHDRLRELRAAVERLAADLKHERERLVSLARYEEEWRSNYSAFVVGGRDPNANAFGFFRNMRNARDLTAWTRDVIIPDLELRLAQAQEALARFEGSAAHA